VIRRYLRRRYIRRQLYLNRLERDIAREKNLRAYRKRLARSERVGQPMPRFYESHDYNFRAIPWYTRKNLEAEARKLRIL